ncbi:MULTISPECIES: beta-N-acetylhexosaminidase [unclassified Streptomyces]|uniref:beta-N-acetylhexosaminidase n=1 Tax=unclassified Streptomyces TaxID=2593676 RepID=UPI0001C1B167|nr:MULTISPECIES: beta-N-acetylhexosaminidase [unclassified Streptomyces]MYR64990.1 family 20 glycosylhydrolase [Streptomyces sp. SID4939]MYS00088.1 family 20 glycosylhydrolase [Streptomyces sp. SID4940]MYT65462.1 family 20 glycosylhydrolase [Streptomyces sp. SID8357]MYT84517.1 family 20 glycosylhydrolase [Streptomyces sp. SID8360]MYW37783.1 family 20 glycosylhydrolase [Streptomyces sp. SID1]
MDNLIPAPVRVGANTPGEGFLPDRSTTLTAQPGTETTERWLRATLGAAFGLPLGPARPGTKEPGNTVELCLDPALVPESYRLVVAPGTGVRITGGDSAGVFWGAQTLRQLLGAEAYRRAPVASGPRRAVPFVEIEDGPRFAWRGLMLDVARHFMRKDDVLRYLDLLAAHKLNVFHFHLTDDQGWRVEIKRHPRLTETASWRARTKYGHRASELWDETPHGGFYTQDDIREIVAYAAERHIRVVPEIDIPGHSQAAISAYPELGNTDVIDTSSLSVWDTWGINPNVLAPTDNTLRFFEGVFEELLDLFPAATSPFIHIGGDECPKDQWKASPAAQARIAELGLHDEEELQSWFIRHFDTWLTARGRRLIGWDEILEGGLADGAAISSWRGYAGGVAAAEAGHDVVMCPEQQVYLDHRQDGGADEPMPIGYVRTLEDVYRFEPVPPGLSDEAARHIIGTQANAWAEVMQNRARVDYQVFPRLAALAEVAWSRLPAPEERDFAGFERRMEAHYARLDALGVDYRPPGGPLPWQRRPGVLGRPIEGPPPNV